MHRPPPPPQPAEPPRLLRTIACPRCRVIAASVFCGCGQFKLPRSVEPFATELQELERRAA